MSGFNIASGYRDVLFGVRWRGCFPVEMPVDVLNNCSDPVEMALAVVEMGVEACEMACVGVEPGFLW